METIGDLRRTHYSDEIDKDDIGKQITVAGSVAKVRNLGSVIFVDLRDTTGVLQLSFDSKAAPLVFAKAEELRSEFCVIAKGRLRERENKNDKLATGNVELYVEELRILSTAQTPPFEVKDGINVNNELRFTYRYLDLRRERAHRALLLRHRITRITHDYFDKHRFIEIETPCLVKSTPEGARDYLVPSRVQQGKFFALPQSPQLYKQLLMLSGFDRYMQIARCFRDEDLRAERQPEFTQVDFEMSYCDEQDIMDIGEGYIKELFFNIKGEKFTKAFQRLKYSDAMTRFGTDKPDIRFGLELCDVTELLKNTEFAVFENAIQKGGSVRLINAVGLSDKLSRKEIDKLTDTVKTYGAKGLAFTRLSTEKSSSFEKFLTQSEISAIYEKANAEQGDVLLLVADEKNSTVFAALGALRCQIAQKFELYSKDDFCFLWITDFPLFEKDEETNRLMAKHHPFTAPSESDIENLEDLGVCATARAYDLVVNGYELGGGSMRINSPELQSRMFKMLGFTQQRMQDSFGFLLDAYRYGAPPHGGMAFGLDRICMLLSGEESIREVIAFPKMQNSGELMTGCPDIVEKNQLDELSI